MTRLTLKPTSILQHILLVLPGGQPPRSAADAFAALIHAVNATLGLQLVGTNENASTVSGDGSDVLPAQWNARSPDFVFKYREPTSHETVLIKIMKLGSKTQVHCILEQTEKSSSMEITTTEYVSPSFFQTEQIEQESLVHGYVSSERLSELIAQYIKSVLRPLLPDLNYEPHSRSPSPAPPSTEGSAPARHRPSEPEFEPPPRIDQPFTHPSRSDNPLEVGRSDLDPIPNPFAGRSPIQPLNPGGGMYVGPGHPMFTQPGARGPPTGGPWGGDGYLPPMGAPPGARFDPIVPFGAGGIGGFPGRGGPGGGPFGPRGRGQFSGEPDNDEFLPPRFGGGRGGFSHDDMFM
ncbi:SubName: Full=Uncharacterized protein {ECO:0000313/EMBL:CCA70609.1} [Serendipita indica DSM 11827]|uniref:Uncharacterized protein n=1 Tax=Serendipita indica (strain DSM 11827) TaxID=1109443 RepID=G4TH10_SERID|nr:SubName: Full=Uncharacterized protein {ECO:0000313/EMBL:CCA70609.1} [Serendipita indica DSM 11827]CCA70609.1 hypothetical protein PIIN_04546 [Serendipita indica DSM 11827]